MEKPDPALFHRALERLGAEPADALHVGDRVELDLAGARAAGIDSVLIDRRAADGTDTATIRDLRQLAR